MTDDQRIMEILEHVRHLKWAVAMEDPNTTGQENVRGMIIGELPYIHETLRQTQKIEGVDEL